MGAVITATRICQRLGRLADPDVQADMVRPESLTGIEVTLCANPEYPASTIVASVRQHGIVNGRPVFGVTYQNKYREDVYLVRGRHACCQNVDQVLQPAKEPPSNLILFENITDALVAALNDRQIDDYLNRQYAETLSDEELPFV